MKFRNAVLFVLASCFTWSVQAHDTEKEVLVTRMINAPVADVWDNWTTREGMKSFFSADVAELDVRIDGLYEPVFNLSAKPGLQGAEGMRFLAIEKPNRLLFTWNAPPIYDVRDQRSVVELTFKQAGEGQTELTLHHHSFGTGGDWPKVVAYFQRVWPKVIDNLEGLYQN